MFVRQLPEANFQSKLGHIPLGSLWQLHRGTPKVCFPPNSQCCLLKYKQAVLATQRSDQKLFLWETFSACWPRSPLWADIPLPSEKEWGGQLLTKTPGWLAPFMPVELAEDYWGILPTTECMSVCNKIKGNWVWMHVCNRCQGWCRVFSTEPKDVAQCKPNWSPCTSLVVGKIRLISISVFMHSAINGCVDMPAANLAFAGDTELSQYLCVIILQGCVWQTCESQEVFASWC